MSTTAIFTYQDIAELIFEVMNPGTKPPTGRELRVAKMAVITAYRDLVNRHAWNYFKRRTLIRTDARYSTGTIAYDHTGGTYERQVTLTTGTWPANAARGVIVIANVLYPVETRESDTVITLDANMNPGADVAALTTYTWYRDAYPLPVDFRRHLSIAEATSGGNLDHLTFVEPGSHHQYTRVEGAGTTNDPDSFTIRSNGDYLGSLDIMFGLAPAEAKTYDLLYEVSPRELRTYKSAAGTIALAAGAVAVVGTNTAFSAFHVGSIIRFTASTTVEPTSVMGNVSGDDNPYLAQRMITAVTDTTHLTIDAEVSATSTLSGTKYVISDPVDVEPIVMRSPLEALAIYQFARLTKRKDALALERDARESMLYAMEQDCRVTIVETVAIHDDDIGNNWGTVDTIPA